MRSSYVLGAQLGLSWRRNAPRRESWRKRRTGRDEGEPHAWCNRCNPKRPHRFVRRLTTKKDGKGTDKGFLNSPNRVLPWQPQGFLVVSLNLQGFYKGRPTGSNGPRVSNLSGCMVGGESSRDCTS